MIIYTRMVDGSLPIKVVEMPEKGKRGKFELLDYQMNVIKEYQSARRLLEDVTRGANTSFTRYFGDVTDVRSDTTVSLFSVGEMKLGIDLAVKYKDVKKILYAHFKSRILRSGFEIEDVLQEVYRGIQTRNLGRCPLDTRKSSFGHYVFIVTECLLNNYHRKESRRREVEQIGMTAPKSMQDDMGSNTVDVALVAKDVASATEVGEDVVAMLMRLDKTLERQRNKGLIIDQRATMVAGMLVIGHSKKEIAEKMSIPTSKVNAIIQGLRVGLS